MALGARPLLLRGNNFSSLNMLSPCNIFPHKIHVYDPHNYETIWSNGQYVCRQGGRGGGAEIGEVPSSAHHHRKIELLSLVLGLHY